MDTRRQARVLNALNHVQPDKVPVDLSAHRSSGMNPQTYRHLRHYLGLPERPVKVYDIIQQLAVLDEDFLDWAGVDTIELGRGFCLAEDEWKPWTLADGTACFIPAYTDGSLVIGCACGHPSQKLRILLENRWPIY